MYHLDKKTFADVYALKFLESSAFSESSERIHVHRFLHVYALKLPESSAFRESNERIHVHRFQ